MSTEEQEITNSTRSQDDIQLTPSSLEKNNSDASTGWKKIFPWSTPPQHNRIVFEFFFYLFPREKWIRWNQEVLLLRQNGCNRWVKTSRKLKMYILF